MKRYDPSIIEKKWQKRWDAQKLHLVSDSADGRKNFMLLTEFPYPSGNLHIGHWYVFAVSDIRARHLRMTGHNVLYPIGFDAFGLPAENAAIKHDTTPAVWTKKNVAFMTKQLRSMGASFDWDRVVNTSTPEYYRWTQWVFLKLYEKGLAYRATTTVNWCPNDKTVLANEQVVNGCCERCTATVEQRDIEQWMFRTTAYADALIDDIEGMDWPSTTVAAQRNWIGRSEGALIRFAASDVSFVNEVEVFTTRADTLFGVTAVVVSPELAQKWLEQGWQAPSAVPVYIKEALGKRELERMEEREKTGVPAGFFVVNPASGEKVPVWVADYVLGSYGTGAVMMVPAHDARDYEFAQKYGIPVKQVIEDIQGEAELPFTSDGRVINSSGFSWADGLLSEDAREEIVGHLEYEGKAERKSIYRLRDWVLSRQRYWGAPIPMIKCAACGYVPVPESELPVKLPPLKDFKPADDGRSPLAKAKRWLRVKCPACGAWAERETDTMDTFVDSSWYFLRYTDPDNAERFASADAMASWLPVPMYIGGPEHNTMHLLYARFITKALHAVGAVPFSEPFTARRNHSVILGPDGNRMSKSRGNVVDPDAEVAKYGADVVRMYLAFMGPYSDQTMPWDPNGITGVHRFVHRVWGVFHGGLQADDADASLERALHAATKKVGEDIADLKYNTAVSALMKLLNVIEQCQRAGGSLAREQAERFCLLLAPFAPHLAEEVWQGILKKKDSVHLVAWPSFDAALLKTATVPVPVQVNGKVRTVLELAPDASEQDAVFAAKADANVARFLEGAELRKVVYLAGKLLNFVVA